MATPELEPGEYSPGEPVFDQETGDAFIDESGEMVQVSPGSVVDRPGLAPLSGDNTANAAWLRANLWRGEAIRDSSVGVPYPDLLGQSNVGLAVTSVVSEVRTRTPGVTGVLGLRVDTYDPTTRVLRFSCNLQTAAGATVPTKVTVVG